MSTSIARNLDVRTMRTLLILLTECSVTKTAEILNLTQPTVSLSLRRLRALLGDPLLVRSGSRMVPTARGIELRAPLQRILDEIDHNVTNVAPFDPQRGKRHFKIVSANCLGTIFVPRLAERLRATSPDSTLEVCPMPNHDALIRMLAEGELDLVMGNWPSPPGQLRMAPLLTTDIVCVVAAHHPLARARRVNMETYLEQHHLSPSAGQSIEMNPIGGRLLELGLSRHVAVRVPDYGTVPYVLAQTNLVFTTGRPFAEHLANLMPFSVIEAPPELGAMHLYMLWHDRSHRSTANRWLRELVRKVAAEFKAIEPGARDVVRRRIKQTT